MKSSGVIVFLTLYFAGFGLQIAHSQPAAASPFGMTGETQIVFDEALSDVGIKIVRYSGPLAAWDVIESRQGVYDWSRLDRLVSETFQADIRMMFTVKSFNRWDQGVPGRTPGSQLFPKNIEAYKQFLTTMVERYDGDGIEDAPGSPVVEYFQIENEVDGHFWDDTPEKYGQLLVNAYEAVKAANPNAQVIIAGVAVPDGFFDFYVPVFDYLASNDSTGAAPFDIFDLHWYGLARNYDFLRGYSFTGFLAAVKAELASRGWNRDMPIWISETATFGGKDVVDKQGNLLPAQDERVQAANLIHRYVYYLANGVETVMWFKMMESHHSPGQGTPNDYFENTGLINNPQNADGLSHKKLAYYTYKFLIDMLDGTDWERIQTIRDSAAVRIYKFTKPETGASLYVAWWEWLDEPGYAEDDSIVVDLALGDVDSVKITQAVPAAESGAELAENDYPAFFASESRGVINGAVSLALKKSPVYIEVDPLPTSVEDPAAAPQNFRLFQNFPNPFNPETTIRYQLMKAGRVTLTIYSLRGQIVRTLVDQHQPAGSYAVAWDGRSEDSAQVSSGIYFYRLKLGAGETAVHKLMVLR